VAFNLQPPTSRNKKKEKENENKKTKNTKGDALRMAEECLSASVGYLSRFLGGEAVDF
jgi:hypothetical protein